MIRRQEDGARQPRSINNKARVHVAVPLAWLKQINRAAKLRNIGRSNFIAQAAFEAATSVIRTGPAPLKAED